MARTVDLGLPETWTLASTARLGVTDDRRSYLLLASDGASQALVVAHLDDADHLASTSVSTHLVDLAPHATAETTSLKAPIRNNLIAQAAYPSRPASFLVG